MISDEKIKEYKKMLNSGELYDSVDDEFIASGTSPKRMTYTSIKVKNTTGNNRQIHVKTGVDDG